LIFSPSITLANIAAESCDFPKPHYNYQLSQ
jgi:hypothetical protein